MTQFTNFDKIGYEAAKLFTEDFNYGVVGKYSMKYAPGIILSGWVHSQSDFSHPYCGLSLKWKLIRTRYFRFTLNEVSFDFGKHQLISDAMARFGGGQLTFNCDCRNYPIDYKTDKILLGFNYHTPGFPVNLELKYDLVTDRLFGSVTHTNRKKNNSIGLRLSFPNLTLLHYKPDSVMIKSHFNTNKYEFIQTLTYPSIIYNLYYIYHRNKDLDIGINTNIQISKKSYPLSICMKKTILNNQGIMKLSLNNSFEMCGYIRHDVLEGLRLYSSTKIPLMHLNDSNEYEFGVGFEMSF